jgi:hypothetical protein
MPYAYHLVQLNYFEEEDRGRLEVVLGYGSFEGEEEGGVVEGRAVNAWGVCVFVFREGNVVRVVLVIVLIRW